MLQELVHLTTAECDIIIEQLVNLVTQLIWRYLITRLKILKILTTAVPLYYLTDTNIN